MDKAAAHNVDGVIQELLAKFLAHAGMLAHKEAKVSQLAEKNRKAASKKKNMSKEIKELRNTIGAAMLNLAATNKKPKNNMKVIEGFKRTLSRDTHATSGEVALAVLGGMVLGMGMVALCICRRRRRATKEFDGPSADPTV